MKKSRVDRVKSLGATAGLLLSGLAPETQADDFPLLSIECETSLALSAAPSNISSDASVYVLTDRGYVKSKEGGNDFSCIVARDSSLSLQPICYDEYGSETILQTILETDHLLLAQSDYSEIYAEINEGLASGRFSQPISTSLSYMLSDFNLYWREEESAMRKARPHYMISTDHTRESIHFDRELAQFHDPLPSISPMGPFRFFIVTAANPTDDGVVRANCGSQLDRFTSLLEQE